MIRGIEALDDFFTQAREIVAGDRSDFNIPPHHVVAITKQPALRSEFDRRLTALNDPELKRLIVDFVRDMADAMDQAASDAERKVELLDRAGVAVAASVTVAGIGTTVATVASGAVAGSLIGPVGLLVGGLVGLVASAWGRDRLKRSANVSKSWSVKFRRLVAKE